MNITPFVLGTMTFGDTCDRPTSASILDLALDRGVSMVDTANVYGGGASETLLGELLGPRRDAVMLATKVGIPHADAAGAAPLSAAAVRACVEGSLKRLRTDHVELLYLHQPDRSTPLTETIDAVAGLIADGTVGALGVSNYAAWQVQDVATACDAAGIGRPVVGQQLYNLLARRIEDEYLEYAGVHGLHTMVYNPLGGGLLTGRHRFDQVPSEGRYGTSALAPMYRGRYWNEPVFAALARLESAGMPMVELAVRWLLGRPGVGSVLVGGSKVEQVEQTLGFTDSGPLPAELLELCDAVGADLRGTMPAYNR